MTVSETSERELSIGALLEAAFDKEPSADLGERVVRRVALAATVSEFVQMFTAAPVHWLRPGVDPDDPEPEGEDP